MERSEQTQDRMTVDKSRLHSLGFRSARRFRGARVSAVVHKHVCRPCAESLRDRGPRRTRNRRREARDRSSLGDLAGRSAGALRSRKQQSQGVSAFRELFLCAFHSPCGFSTTFPALALTRVTPAICRDTTIALRCFSEFSGISTVSR
jgi:hypothetical protein